MNRDPVPARPVALPVFPEFGPRIGLIGDAHGDLDFLLAAVHALHDRGVDSIAQLGDFGMIWHHDHRDWQRLERLNTELAALGRHLLVVTGNHENYDAIAAMPVDADGVRRLGPTWILPRSGRGTAAGRSLGWLSGAASIDLNRRGPASWWAAELPTDEETVAFLTGGPVDIVLAHDALATRHLAERLARTDDLWDPDGRAYAEYGRTIFTARVLRVLADGGLVASGHYHARVSVGEVLTRPNGEPVQARNEILSSQFNGDSVGVLDTTTLAVQGFAVA